MLKKLLVIGILFSFLGSCIRDDFETVKSTGNLGFSKDTVYLDTVFSNIGTSTRTLKIYNKSSENISIPSVRLGRGEESFYRLNVDGMAGKTFENIEILSKDSIFIFIEATIDFSKVINPIYTDSIVFDSGANQQDVKLVTLVQDAHFLFPRRDADGVKEKIVLGIDGEGNEISVDGFYLGENTVWNDEKPYVIYGYVGVPEYGKLTINKGARIHFHNNSGLLVEKYGSLKVLGVPGEEVIFEGDRLEPGYSDIPGQWGTIWLRAGSKEHFIENAIIKNNSLGILMDSIGSMSSPTLKMHNVQIYNTSTFGLLGRTAGIQADNLVIANAGMAVLGCTLGGSYSFTHCTFANYWNNSIRDYPALYISNFTDYTGQDGTVFRLVRDLKSADFTNCIIEGNQSIEMILSMDENKDFNYFFKNNLIRFDESKDIARDPLYDFDNTNHYLNNILNGNPDFKNTDENIFLIGGESDANAAADLNAALQFPQDLLGIDRTVSPDIGAYQHIIFEE